MEQDIKLDVKRAQNGKGAIDGENHPASKKITSVVNNVIKARSINKQKINARAKLNDINIEGNLHEKSPRMDGSPIVKTPEMNKRFEPRQTLNEDEW